MMIEGGIRDFALAKRKAAERLGQSQTRNLPTNQEVEAARGEYLRLFRAESQPLRLRQLREAALKAMQLLEPYQLRLVGPVLAGTADENSPVYLHLFTDTPEQIDWFLNDRGIPFAASERKVRLDAERQANLPMYRLMAGDITIELTVFPPALRQPPLSPVDGRPMRRAGRQELEQLLQD